MNEEEYTLIPLASGKGFAKVSPEDLCKVQNYSWYLNIDGYAATEIEQYTHRKQNRPRKVLLMHRLILNIAGKARVDHINRDRTDNRRSNLRTAAGSQNAANSLGHVGKRVSLYKGVVRKRDSWLAKIKKDRLTYNLGTFRLEEDAAKAYDSAALFLFGDFATTNFPDSVPMAPDKIKHLSKEQAHIHTLRTIISRIDKQQVIKVLRETLAQLEQEELKEAALKAPAANQQRMQICSAP